jgi:hypothetical protein
MAGLAKRKGGGAMSLERPRIAPSLTLLLVVWMASATLACGKRGPLTLPQASMNEVFVEIES